MSTVDGLHLRRASICASLMVLAACGKPPPPAPAPPASVVTMTISTQPVTLSADLPGRTKPHEVSDVRPQVSGIIQARLFEEGANVRKGQALYQIDPAPYRATLDQSMAQLASARATLVSAKLKAERYADMIKINAVSRQEADDAEAAYGQDAAAVLQQQAAVESARINLEYTRVTAPISGRIGASTYTAGALVTNGQANALATIQSLDPIYVDVTQSAVEHLKLGNELARVPAAGRAAQDATVHLLPSAGFDYPEPGHLQFTDITVDQNTGSVTLRAQFPNPKGILLPGLYVRARIVMGVDPAGILVPQPAVTRDEKGRPIALVIDPQGRAQQRILEVADAVGNQWRVTSGLTPGDRLIIEGGGNVKPGAPVRERGAAPPAASAAHHP